MPKMLVDEIRKGENDSRGKPILKSTVVTHLNTLFMGRRNVW